MGRHGVGSLRAPQGSAVTAALSFYCQVPEFAQPAARMGTIASYRDAIATIRSLMTGRSNHWAAVAWVASGLCTSPASHALDAVVFEVRQVEIDGMVVRDASMRLDLLDEEHTRLTLKARDATLPEPVGRLSQLQLVCPRPVVAEPRFGCEAGKLTARGGPTASIDMNVTAMLHTDTGITQFTGKD